MRRHTKTADSWLAGRLVFWLISAWKRLKVNTECTPMTPSDLVSPSSSWKYSGYGVAKLSMAGSHVAASREVAAR
jgi:hypothetical protein